jgi:uncharacterized protein (TIGR02246 family)
MSLRDEIDAINSEFGKAASNQDLDGVMDLYAPDAWLLPPGAPLIQGKDGIRAFFGMMLDAGVQGLELESMTVEGNDELAVDIGRYRLTIVPPGADPMTDEGKYIVVMKRQPDGKLRLAYDAFNSDAPA